MFSAARILGSKEVFLALLAISLLGVLFLKNISFIHDDAFISLRYALNFSQTGLPQWNPGEWAEGYTSFLHVALTAGMIKIGFDPVFAARLINSIAVVCLLYFCARTARLYDSGLFLERALLIVSVAGSHAIAVWALGGLETTLSASLAGVGLFLLLADLHRPHPAGILLAAFAFSAAVLTRLDTAVFTTGSAVAVLLLRDGPLKQRFVAATVVVGLPAAVAFLQMGIRYSVYGELFPLTFYAKTDIALAVRVENGVRYILMSLREVPLLALSGGMFLASVALRRVTKPAVMVALPCFLHVVYVVWAGGDHMPAARMLVLLIAPAAFLVFVLASAFPKRTRILCMFLLAALPLFKSANRPPQKMDSAAFGGEIVGRHIEATWPRGITIALNTAGSTPYFATKGRRFIDMLGLNDPVIAKRENVPILTGPQRWPGHSKGDGAYVLSRAPDRIILSGAAGTDIADAWFLSGAEMSLDPEFDRCYEKRVDEITYSSTFARRGPAMPNPLVFTYYQRVCE